MLTRNKKVLRNSFILLQNILAMNNLTIYFRRDPLFVRWKKIDGKTLFAKEVPFCRTSYFMERLDEVIHTQMGEEDFGIPRLCQLMGISRSQLHNRIKQEMGLSTSHYVNHFRLKKAHRLLRTTDLNLSEIAYQVGFNSLNYFSNCYLKEYGIRPSKERT